MMASETKDSPRGHGGVESRFFIAFLVLAWLTAVVWAVGHYAGVAISPRLLLALRWASLVVFCAYAWTRRSLTVWIFAGMLLGAEIGYDWPHAAANLQILSSIFLRLIRTIVAPLIFATLVVGIAGHSNLKDRKSTRL